MAMCRMMLWTSKSGELPPKQLLEGLVRIAEKDRFGKSHGNGWGMGWVDPQGGVGLYRNLKPIWESQVNLPSQTLTLILHARRGSHVAPENTHPFRCGRLILAHNGMVSKAFTRPLTRHKPQGVTDSEAYLCLLAELLEEEDLVEALRRSLELVKVKTALNLLIIHLAENPREGEAYALNYFRAESSEEASKGYYTLHWRLLDEGLAVASEPLDEASWTPISLDGKPILLKVRFGAPGKFEFLRL